MPPKSAEKKKRRRKALAAAAGAALLLAAVAAFALYVLIPTGHRLLLRGVCRAEAASCYALAAAPGDTLYISLPGTPARAALSPDSVAARTDISAAFVTASGHAATSDSLLFHAPDTLPANRTRALLQRLDTVLAAANRRDSLTLRELDYYARTHSVVDDGYNEVMAFRQQLRVKLHGSDSTLARLRLIASRPTLPAARLHAACRLVWSAPADSACYRCDTLPAHIALRGRDGLLLLQADSRRLPAGAAHLAVLRFGTLLPATRLLAFNDFGGKTASPLPATLIRRDTALPATEGGIWINALGHPCGVSVRGASTPARSLPRLLHKAHCWHVWWREDLKALLHLVTRKDGGGTLVRLPAPARCVRMETGGAVYEGQSKDGRHRDGWGRLTLGDGASYEGLWRGDSLLSGTRADSTGLYSGGFGTGMRPEGNGLHISAADGYYCGEWSGGRRHGFGFAVNGGSFVRCGTWRNGSFRGERMVYTANRVYGIDISRYQHEIGKKKYAIDWTRLRITGLGANRRVQGKVDYPVSFVYVKCTQGKTVLNRYYAADMRAARRHGIAAGAYHFYSTLSGAKEQASWFLSKAAVAAGDMSPVLDVEPSEGQIARLGGEQRLFSEMLVWLRAVEAGCGKRPVLYLSQQFVNRHFPAAPSELRGYEVWIARYGEYKPYVHLLHWQLTPYGRVTGIKGDVDINVYNGTPAQFAGRFH